MTPAGRHGEGTFALILTDDPDGGMAYRCGRGEGRERFLKLFRSLETAEAHVMLDPATARVVEWPAGYVCAFVEVFAPGNFEYVAIDPPLTVEDGPPQPVRAIAVDEVVEACDQG